ncbi:alginate lyase family protein [Massilia orientalis]|uniref:Alginate lyase family protein n=1 Tax=Massilia orientalis TaxID=3050128 RepID=A0ACC7MDC5_9BURK|nr:alginate lyase family protein [Massilia sp. YIM B02787]
MRIRGLGAGMCIAVLAARPAGACEAPPPAVVDIDANSYYSDSHHSIVDPVRKARNEAAVKPVNDYLDAVAHAAVAWQRTHRDADARCALTWLASWADRKAMLGTMTTEQSYYTRKWTLGGLALGYARVKPAATLDERRRIEAWLLALADATMRHSDAHKGVRNNHYYWEGLAVTATGAVTGDARCLAWGRKVFDDAMAQIRPDGVLPYELERAGRALHYHLYAAAPLVLMASIFDVQSPQLDKLIAFSVGGVADPSAIAKMTGVEQAWSGGVPGWIAIYLRHGGKAAVPVKLPAVNWDARMGGDRSLANPLEHVVTGSGSSSGS